VILDHHVQRLWRQRLWRRDSTSTRAANGRTTGRPDRLRRVGVGPVNGRQFETSFSSAVAIEEGLVPKTRRQEGSGEGWAASKTLWWGFSDTAAHLADAGGGGTRPSNSGTERQLGDPRS
jgi:hypothetical protein